MIDAVNGQPLTSDMVNKTLLVDLNIILHQRLS